MQVRKRKGKGNSINRSIDHLKLINTRRPSLSFPKSSSESSDRCTDGAFLPPAPLHTMSLPSPSLAVSCRCSSSRIGRRTHAQVSALSCARMHMCTDNQLGSDCLSVNCCCCESRFWHPNNRQGKREGERGAATAASLSQSPFHSTSTPACKRERGRSLWQAHLALESRGVCAVGRERATLCRYLTRELIESCLWCRDRQALLDDTDPPTQVHSLLLLLAIPARDCCCYCDSRETKEVGGKESRGMRSSSRGEGAALLSVIRG